VFFTYIASSERDISYAGSLGAVTVIIILAGQEINLIYAVGRTLEVLTGISIALLISASIFPIYALKVLRHKTSKNLGFLADLYQEIIDSPAQLDTAKTELLEEKISKGLLVQQKLIAESSAEHRKKHLQTQELNNLLYCQRRIYRLTHTVQSIALESADSLATIKQIKAITEFHHMFIDTLRALADYAPLNKRQTLLADLSKLLDDIAIEINKLTEDKTNSVSVGIHAWWFCIQVLVKQINEMARILAKLN